MLVFLTILILLSLILIVTSIQARRHLHPFEIVTNWIFLSALLFVCSNIVEVNQKWIEVEDADIQFWILTINRLFIIPGLTLWLLFVYSSITMKKIYKIICTGLWFFVLIGLQFFYNFIGLIHFKQWNIYLSFMEWFILWLLTVGYWASFRFLLKKEEVL